MVDILESIERDEFAMERIATALERIAGALTERAIIERNRFEKEYPKREPRDATITKIPSEEDKRRESLGSTGEESTEDWLSLGPREQKVILEKSSKK